MEDLIIEPDKLTFNIDQKSFQIPINEVTIRGDSNSGVSLNLVIKNQIELLNKLDFEIDDEQNYVLTITFLNRNSRENFCVL